MTEHDYERDVYARWEQLESTKVLIDPGDGGENLWGRVVPGIGVALDNHPLSAEYRYQDIVGRGLKPPVIHRRWNGRVGFMYDPITGQGDADMTRRKEIYERLAERFGEEPIVVSFMFAGVGWVFTRDDDESHETVEATLAELDYIIDVQPRP